MPNVVSFVVPFAPVTELGPSIVFAATAPVAG